MSNTVNNNIPLIPENTIDPAAGLNLSLVQIDSLLQVLVVSVGANTPPASPANGARYIVGTSPTGAWAGQANKLAMRLDGAWRFSDSRYVLNAADALFYIRPSTTWVAVDISAAIAAHVALADPHDQYQLKKFDNLTATTDPTAADDSADGYQLLSRWFNTTTKELWFCVDPAAGAAVWKRGT
jgi:hypothetical protein